MRECVRRKRRRRGLINGDGTRRVMLSGHGGWRVETNETTETTETTGDMKDKEGKERRGDLTDWIEDGGGPWS